MRTVDRPEGMRGGTRVLELSTLPAPDVPATVRALLELRLQRWGLSGLRGGALADDLRLCADELVANAGAATPNEKITFRAFFVPVDRAIVLSTWDGSDALPVVRAVVELTAEDIVPDAHALDVGHHTEQVGGWGLPMVVALSTSQGVQRTEPRGKWVWARFEF